MLKLYNFSRFHSNLPPGPSIFNLIKIQNNSILEASLTLIQLYGDIICLSKKELVFLIANPYAIEKILKTNINNYSKNTNSHNRMKIYFGTGSLLSDGQEWAEKRQHTQIAFQSKNFDVYAAIMEQHIEFLVHKWNRYANEKQTVDLVKEISQFTTQIAVHAFFGNSVDDTTIASIEKAILECHKHIVFNRSILPAILDYKVWKFDKNNYTIERFLKRFLKTNHPNKTHNTLLSLLINAKENRLSEECIIDELKTILATGQETTACSVCWTLYLLDQNPIQRQLVEEELKDTLKGRRLTKADLSNLPYLKAVIQESLRLYPPIPMINRTLLKEDTFLNYCIPENSEVIVNLYATHRNKTFWDNPNVFDPDRFLDHRINERPRFAYIPFSVGPRTCIASHFAMLELQLTLGTLIQHFQVAFESKTPIHPIPMISLRPEKHMRVQIKHLKKL